MKQYRYGVVGNFAFQKEIYGGQIAKTQNFAAALKAAVGDDRVLCVDTQGWQKQPAGLVCNIAKTLRTCRDVVILPSGRGVQVIPALVKLLRGLGKNRLYYVVVGGWLPEFLQEHPGIARLLKDYDGIFVETETMKTKLKAMGFDNLEVLPNFKQLDLLKEEELVYPAGEPYRLCTFSQVRKEKGIEEAVRAVTAVNTALGKTAYTLDIYGPVNEQYRQEFAALQAALPGYITYKGQVDGARSTQIIKDYFALLFPTYYPGEGYPGTLLDAYSAGVPVIASDWRYNAELVGVDKGFLFEAKNTQALTAALEELAREPQRLLEKKKACLAYARTMAPEKMIEIFTNFRG